jgi:hypothetical protein
LTIRGVAQPCHCTLGAWRAHRDEPTMRDQERLALRARGRLLGLASGDRPLEFPAFGVDIERRAALFRGKFEVVRRVLETEYQPFKLGGRPGEREPSDAAADPALAS